MIKIKKMKITFDKGLDNSLKVLKELKKIPEMKKAVGYVDIGCFTNCRECGLTFKVRKGNGDSFTWCVYEHRNSDEIIVNGKDGYISMSDDLPYKADDKWGYIKAFPWKEYKYTAQFLAAQITRFVASN